VQLYHFPVASQYLVCLLLAGASWTQLAPASLSQSSFPTAETAPPPISPSVNFNLESTDGSNPSAGSISGFIPLWQVPGAQLGYFQGSLQLTTDDGLVNSSWLVGQRWTLPNSDRILGGYLAYDTRNTGAQGFNQLGIGLETLGQSWDLRTNAFFPLGQRQSTLSQTLVGDPFFQGRQLLSDSIIERESALGGFDLEAGLPLVQWNAGELRGYGGFYYYSNPDGNNALGWRTRLEATTLPGLRTNLTLQDDPLFGTRVSVGAAVQFGGTPPGQRQSQLGRPVQRPSTIAVNRRRSRETVIFRDPETGQPLRILHVDLDADHGAGTFERPLGNLQTAASRARSGEIIYVRARSNSPSASGFRLPDGTSLLSAAIDQDLNVFRFGSITLPALSGNVLPQISSTLTVGSNNVVSGFSIDGGGIGRGIFGENLTNARLINNQVTNTTDEGIFLRNAFGHINISNNVVTDVIFTNTGGDGAGIEGGIVVTNTRGLADITIANNQVRPRSDVDGIEVNMFGTARATARILNNHISELDDDGIDIDLADEGQLDLIISGNRIENLRDRGISFVTAGNAQSTTRIENNVLTNIGTAIADGDGDALGIRFRGNSRSQMVIANNIIDGTGDEGIDIQLDDSLGFNTAVAQVEIRNNQIRNTDNDGIQLEAENQGRLEVDITGNTLENIGNDIIDIEIVDDATARIRIQNNLLSRTLNDDDGIQLDAEDNAQVELEIIGNTIRDVGDNGVNLNIEDAANVLVRILDNLIENAVAEAIDADIEDDAVARLEIIGNLIRNAGEQGIDVTVEENGQAIVLIDRNRIEGSGEEGIRIRAQVDGAAEVTAIVTNNQVEDYDRDDEGSSGILVRARDDSPRLCLRLTGNDVREGATGRSNYEIRRQNNALLQVEQLSDLENLNSGSATSPVELRNIAPESVASGACGTP
jgi:hypothetical protein